jgi:hypothetical protein
MPETIDKLLHYCRQNGRICPLPPQWNDLYQLLPDTRHKGVGWEPALPLILVAWWEATDHEKQERLEHHIRWPYNHGVYDRVSSFLYSLAESQWHHSSD